MDVDLKYLTNAFSSLIHTCTGAAGSNNKEASGVVPASAAPVPVSVAASALSTSGIASLSLTLTPAQSQARARAVRLLREAASASAASAAAAGHAAAAAAATGAGSGEDTFSNNSNANMNSGELAFAAEKLAMEVLGGPAQPRYLEFITRLAAKLKVSLTLLIWMVLFLFRRIIFRFFSLFVL